MINSDRDSLIKHTYNKIFFEDLNILQTDIEEIKKFILKTEKLLSNKLDRFLFISELTEKLKIEKIDEANKQYRELGTVLMNDFDKILQLYNWLEGLHYKDPNKPENEKSIWIVETSILENLSKYLHKNMFTETPEDFYNVVSDTNSNRVNWLKSKTLIIYLFIELKKRKYINPKTSENSFIENGFLHKGKLIENIKQSKQGMRDNKNSKPSNFKEIDSFFYT